MKVIGWYTILYFVPTFYAALPYGAQEMIVLLYTEKYTVGWSYWFSNFVAELVASLFNLAILYPTSLILKK